MAKGAFAVLLSAAVVSATAGTAVARDFCGEISALVGDAAGDFSQSLDVSQAEADGPLSRLAHEGEADCAVAGPAGGRYYICLWQYPYRAAAATQTFALLDREVRACLGSDALASDDPGVNHPDSYDQRRYAAGEATVSVALKDKSARGGTFIFFRVEGASP